MLQPRRILKALSSLWVIVLATLTINAQQQAKPAASPDVIRVDTNLVQTTLMVFDKKGMFVDGLRPEDFALKVDGQPVSILFFSRITAGTTHEQSQLAAVRKGAAGSLSASKEDAEERGRTVVFFIDDLHLSASSVHRTKQVIQTFLNTQMGPFDQVAIASASGQIGFLQQFTDNKAVLRAAVGRLTHRPYTVIDSENIPMTEYTALRVEQGDRDAITYYTNQLLLANNFRSPGGALGPPASAPVGRTPAQNQRSSGLSREMAERMVKERALVMLKQSTAVTTNTLFGLESLIHTAAQSSGRKLVFFVSDGFYLNDRNTSFASKLRELTDAAVRAGVVIYSLDARGLSSTVDVTSNRADPEGKLSRSNVGELAASQDGLNALAADTGGRALFDSDRLSEAVDRGLQETSNYYLLAWRPATDEQKNDDFKRLEIAVVDRPELSVRRPRSYLAPSPVTTVTSAANQSDPKAAHAERPADLDLRNALNAAVPATTVPTSVAVTFVDTPDNGLVVTASVQAASSSLDFGPDGKQATVDLAGVILNDQGKTAATFKTRLNVTPLPADVNPSNGGVVYNYKTKVTPGLYQLRAAVRDDTSKKVGSAAQWIEIPDLSSHKLTLSSLLVRSRPLPAQKKSDPAGLEVPFSVDRHFARASQLGFLLFIYNASRGPQANAAPDVTAQVQVFRHGQAIIGTPLRKLSVEGMTDLGRMPYAGQFPLETLSKGRYELQITISDKLANARATQRVSFRID
jgi:VWFA-related protein